jgi:hypothetical protein
MQFLFKCCHRPADPIALIDYPVRLAYLRLAYLRLAFIETISGTPDIHRRRAARSPAETAESTQNTATP